MKVITLNTELSDDIESAIAELSERDELLCKGDVCVAQAVAV